MKTYKEYINEISVPKKYIPKIIYHGTSAKYASSILKNGLKINLNKNFQDFSQSGVIYLTDNQENAQEWAFRSNPEDETLLLVYIDSTKIDITKLQLDSNDYFNDKELEDQIKRKKDLYGIHYEYHGNIPLKAITNMVQFKNYRQM